MAGSVKNMGLTSLDDLFKSEQERQQDTHERILNIPVAEIHPYARQPYSIKRPTPDLVRLMDSIEQVGVAEPLIVRPRTEGGYEITSFHRQSFQTRKGETEFWRCKAYRQQGKDGCDLPAIRTNEVDLVLADLFQKVVTEKKQIIQLVLDSIRETACGVDYSAQIGRIEVQISQIEEKKDKLLELSMADAITLQEFKVRNGRFNRQISALEEQRMSQCQQKRMQKSTEIDPKLLEKALWEELNFTNGIQSEVVATILDHIVVLEQSDNKQIYLEIYLRLGQQASAHFQRGELVSCDSPLTCIVLLQ